TGQAAARLSLRSAGSHARLRAGAGLRRARFRSSGARGPPGIVVGYGRLLRRALLFGNVAQVDPDARPGGRASAHGVDEDIVLVEPRRGLGVPGLPALEAGQRVPFLGRPGDGDEWLRGLSAAAPFAARVRDLPS